ncbi:hypothetical protein BGLT_00403 [Caballeronia glathei]|jgi:hypothetical protein|nr:hypothetical protein BGLT_00403 [Caballeronia glathei]
MHRCPARPNVRHNVLRKRDRNPFDWKRCDGSKRQLVWPALPAVESAYRLHNGEQLLFAAATYINQLAVRHPLGNIARGLESRNTDRRKLAVRCEVDASRRGVCI